MCTAIRIKYWIHIMMAPLYLCFFLSLLYPYYWLGFKNVYVAPPYKEPLKKRMCNPLFLVSASQHVAASYRLLLL